MLAVGRPGSEPCCLPLLVAVTVRMYVVSCCFVLRRKKLARIGRVKSPGGCEAAPFKAGGRSVPCTFEEAAGLAAEFLECWVVETVKMDVYIDITLIYNLSLRISIFYDYSQCAKIIWYLIRFKNMNVHVYFASIE